jgi:hypothetical protein
MDSIRSNSRTLDNLEWSPVGTHFVYIASMFTSSRMVSTSKGLRVRLLFDIHVRKLFQSMVANRILLAVLAKVFWQSSSALCKHIVHRVKKRFTQATCPTSVLYTFSCKNIAQECLLTSVLPVPCLGNRYLRRVFFTSLVIRFFSKTVVKYYP